MSSQYAITQRVAHAVRRIACAIAIGVAIACGGDGDAGDRVVELTELRLFDTRDGINDIRGIAIGRRSDLWVIGSPPPFIHHFDSSGKLIASFGRGGQGPGELTTPFEIFAPNATDSLVRVWSPGRAVFTAFSEDGSFVGATKPVAMSRGMIPNWMDKVDYIRVRQSARWNDRFLVQDVPPAERGLTSVAQLANGRVLVVDSAGTVVDTLVDFRTLTGPARPAPGVMYLAVLPLWTVCPAGHVVLADPYGMKLRHFGTDGAPAGADTIPLQQTPLTDDDIRRYVRNWSTVPENVRAIGAVPDSIVERTADQILTTRRAEAGTIAPPVVRILCDEDNRLWLQRYDTDDEPRGLSRDWVVVDAGRIVQRYRFPARFQPLTLHAGNAFGVQKDSLDVERVAVARYGAR